MDPLQPRDLRGPHPRARGARRRAGHLRRRAAADARVRHRHLRRAAPAAAHAAVRPARARPPFAGRMVAGRARTAAGRPARAAGWDVDGTAHEVDPPATTAVTPPWSDEAPRADVADAVTFSFADVAAGVYGLARAGFTADGASGLGVLFAGAEPVAARATRRPGADGRAWEAIDAAGVRTTIVEPLRLDCRVRRTATGHGFALEVTALAEPPPTSSAGGRVGGMTGYEHLCRVARRPCAPAAGSVPSTASASAAHCGARPDWDRLELARTVGGVARGRPRRRAAPPCAPPAPAAGRRGAARPCRRGRRGGPGGRRPAAVAPCVATYDGPPAPRGPRAVGRRGGATRAAPPARSCAARRSTSAGCGWTARSSAGGWRAARASGATTSCAARTATHADPATGRDPGDRQRLRRRPDHPADPASSPFQEERRHPAGGAGRAIGGRDEARRARTRCSSSSAAAITEDDVPRHARVRARGGARAARRHARRSPTTTWATLAHQRGAASRSCVTPAPPATASRC